MVIKKSSVEKDQSSFETPACQDMSLGVKLLSGELREMEVAGDRKEMARNELDCAKETSCLI
jgi:hypothetical protein